MGTFAPTTHYFNKRIINMHIIFAFFNLKKNFKNAWLFHLKYKNLNKTLSLISLEDNYTNKKKWQSAWFGFNKKKLDLFQINCILMKRAFDLVMEHAHASILFIVSMVTGLPGRSKGINGVVSHL
jgi:hypothetical protein